MPLLKTSIISINLGLAIWTVVSLVLAILVTLALLRLAGVLPLVVELRRRSKQRRRGRRS
jgi:Flp pilus assembly protein TadB